MPKLLASTYENLGMSPWSIGRRPAQFQLIDQKCDRRGCDPEVGWAARIAVFGSQQSLQKESQHVQNFLSLIQLAGLLQPKFRWDSPSVGCSWWWPFWWGQQQSFLRSFWAYNLDIALSWISGGLLVHSSSILVQAIQPELSFLFAVFFLRLFLPPASPSFSWLVQPSFLEPSPWLSSLMKTLEGLLPTSIN